MRKGAMQASRVLLPAAAWILLGSSVQAQESLIAACGVQGGCTYQRAYAVTLQGKDSIRVVAPAAANDAQGLRKARSVRVNSVQGLYREPRSGLVRVVNAGWGPPGDVAVPSRLPQGAATASAALTGAAFEYQAQAKSKVKVSVPIDQFVLLLRGPGLERAVVEFLKHELRADEPHPRQADLLAGALSFAETSPELGAWREDLRTTMRRSLEAFRHGGVDPARLEATLDEGLAAMRMYRLVALKGQEESALQDELAVEHRALLQRFAIAGILKRAQLHDAFLEKIGQIGLARWSRPELAAGVEDSRRASAQAHYERAAALLADKQYDRAFDEARIANSRASCDAKISGFYDSARVQFVDRRRILVSPDYAGEHRTVLEQIVRQIQGIGRDAGLTPERIEYVHKRIGDGETTRQDRTAPAVQEGGVPGKSRRVHGRARRRHQCRADRAPRRQHGGAVAAAGCAAHARTGGGPGAPRETGERPYRQ